MARKYSEADTGPMPRLPSQIGLTDSPSLKGKQKAVPKRRVSKFNRNKLKGATNKIYK